MVDSLERDLGLLATLTISIGAMIGSGIFVLPGLAAAKAGPAVILAYFLAGVLVLPAALSKAEMATAIPESGGTYLYIDRAMGPLPGTVAGIGAWFSLVFKSAFALVGLGAYLLVLVSIPAGLLTVVSLGLAGCLVVINVVGVKQTGRLQTAIVGLVLLALIGFIADGGTYVNRPLYHPFFEKGAGGLFAATGFVFVSYAGVTKIASVAEEVEDPGHNIPRAILGSTLLMMLVYTLTAFVIVGVTPPDLLHESLTPMSDAASEFAGPVAGLGVAVVAVLALTSMANAGILSSSRYPLAMSRDSLAPARLGVISDRFRTPVAAIGFTGLVLAVLIAFVPVGELAKLASAFQILVFAFVNVALIAFRESELDWYDPDFEAPGYPWVQLFGILGGAALLTQMGALPLAGAAGIVLAGLLWYRLYGREKTDREGAALDAIRRSVSRRALGRTAAAFDVEGRNVLVAVRTETAPERVRSLSRLGAAVADVHGGRLHVVVAEGVPQQTGLESARERIEPNPDIEREVAAAAGDTPVTIERAVTHDPKQAVVTAADETDAETILAEWEPDRFGVELLGSDVDWYVDNAPCDLSFLRDRGLADIEEVTVLVEPGFYHTGKVVIADAIAAHNDATLRFVTAVGADASAELTDAAHDFYEGIGELSTADTEWDVVASEKRIQALVDAAAGTGLVVLGAGPKSTVRTLLFGNVAVEISDRVGTSALLVYPDESGTRTFLRRVLEWLVFGGDAPSRTTSTAG